MREILFRGKRVDNGEWVFGYFSNFGENVQIFTLYNYTEEEKKEMKGHFIGFTKGYWSIVDPETVGQYTGLKDKNGNRIFEGDIVKYNWDNSWCKDNKFYIETYIVEYLQYGFKPFIENYDCNDGYYSYNIDFNSIEIIGDFTLK